MKNRIKFYGTKEELINHLKEEGNDWHSVIESLCNDSEFGGRDLFHEWTIYKEGEIHCTARLFYKAD